MNMNRFPLNIIDIGPLIKKVIHYSEMILKKFIGMLHDIKYFIKRFVLSLFKYTHVFIIISISLLGFTLLLSKNKLGNLLILSYLLIMIAIFGFMSGIIALFIICIEKTISLIKQVIKLTKMEKKISIKSIINIVIVILVILLFALEFAFVLGFLAFLALIVDFLFGLSIKIFNTINGLYSTTSFVAQTATTAVDSFGTMIRKGFEKCD